MKTGNISERFPIIDGGLDNDRVPPVLDDNGGVNIDTGVELGRVKPRPEIPTNPFDEFRLRWEDNPLNLVCMIIVMALMFALALYAMGYIAYTIIG